MTDVVTEQPFKLNLEALRKYQKFDKNWNKLYDENPPLWRHEFCDWGSSCSRCVQGG